MSNVSSRQIAHLDSYVSALAEAEQELWRRIYMLHVANGELVVPPAMEPWVETTFGSVEVVRRQRVIKLLNLITAEGTLYNPLRAARPVDLELDGDAGRMIEETRGGAFCHPHEMTPEDVFGRIEGQYCITAGNIAKYDGFHSLVIFDEHNPLQVGREHIHDYVDTAMRWARRAHNADREAQYFFMMWNCLWKAGASIVHGHMQLTLGRGMHYARVEHWRRQALLYRLAHNQNYFDDLYRLHEALGLGVRLGETRVLALLTPIKEKEILLISPTRWVHNDDFKDAISAVLRAYLERLGVQSFNLALYQRPIDSVTEDWNGFPAMVRLVDRGPLRARTTDVGCMELYGSSVVTTDPFRVIEALRF